MGEHITTRPTGPSYVPGTLKGQSSPYASNAPSAENNLQAQTTVPVAAPGTQPPATTPAVPVNPSQAPRTKFAAPTPGSPISQIKLAGQPIRMPGTIGSVN